MNVLIVVTLISVCGASLSVTGLVIGALAAAWRESQREPWRRSLWMKDDE